jgi:hypothetical protein
MSDFIRIMEKEDNDWKTIVAEFEASLAQGIRGAAGLRRRNVTSTKIIIYKLYSSKLITRTP